jgi:hypothetical protein
LPPLRFRLHPATGLVPFVEGDSINALSTDPALVPWKALPDAERDSIFDAWLERVLRVLASRPDAEVYLDLADRQGLEQLLESGKCERGSNQLAIRCRIDDDTASLLVAVNPSRGVFLIGGEVAVCLFGSWEGLFIANESVELRDELEAVSQGVRNL